MPQVLLSRGGKIWKVIDRPLKDTDQYLQEHHFNEDKTSTFTKSFLRNISWGSCPCCGVVRFDSVNYLYLPHWVKISSEQQQETTTNKRKLKTK